MIQFTANGYFTYLTLVLLNYFRKYEIYLHFLSFRKKKGTVHVAKKLFMAAVVLSRQGINDNGTG